MSQGQIDDEIEHFTRDEALQIARAEMKRAYVERDDNIAYIGYLPNSMISAFASSLSSKVHG